MIVNHAIRLLFRVAPLKHRIGSVVSPSYAFTGTVGEGDTSWCPPVKNNRNMRGNRYKGDKEIKFYHIGQKMIIIKFKNKGLWSLQNL